MYFIYLFIFIFFFGGGILVGGVSIPLHAMLVMTLFNQLES